MFSRSLSHALRAAHWPKFRGQRMVVERTLGLYRNMLRAIGKFPDTLVQRELRVLARDLFVRHSYETAPMRVMALLEIAEAELQLVEAAALLRSRQDLHRVYLRALTAHRLRVPKSAHLLPEQLQESVLRAAGVDRSHPTFELQTNQIPPIEELPLYSDWRTYARTSSYPLMKLRRILAAMKKRARGFTDRQTMFEPTFRLTWRMKVPPPYNQKRAIRKWASQFARTAPRPLHPDALQHIEQVLKFKLAQVPAKTKSANLRMRPYLRRLKDIARDVYTIEHESDGIKVRRCQLGSRPPSWTASRATGAAA